MNLRFAIVMSCSIATSFSTPTYAIDGAVNDGLRKSDSATFSDVGQTNSKSNYPDANITEAKNGGDFAACFRKTVGLNFHVVDDYGEKRVTFEKSSYREKEAILKKVESGFNDKDVPFYRYFTYYDDSGRSILGLASYMGSASNSYSSEEFDVPESYPEQAEPGSTIVQTISRSGGHRGSGFRDRRALEKYSYTINTVFEGFKNVEINGVSKIFTSVCHFSRSGGMNGNRVDFFIAPEFDLIYRTTTNSKNNRVNVTWRLQTTEAKSTLPHLAW